MSGRMSRNKGAAGEREFLRLLGEELGTLLTRNLQQTRDSGADCLVVKGWAIEVKRCERLSRGAWWRQAVAQADREGVQPMLAYRRNREPWRVWIEPGKDISLQEAAGAIREKWLRWP
jgi:Holliday junction resolvase